MDLLFGLILGVLLTLLLVKQPLKFEITHKNITDKQTISDEQLRVLEENLLKPDDAKDKELEKLDEAIVEANNILGGSDRI